MMKAEEFLEAEDRLPPEYKRRASLRYLFFLGCVIATAADLPPIFYCFECERWHTPERPPTEGITI